MLESRLSNLSMISIESEILNNLDTRQINRADFASIKARKVPFLYVPTYGAFHDKLDGLRNFNFWFPSFFEIF